LWLSTLTLKGLLRIWKWGISRSLKEKQWEPKVKAEFGRKKNGLVNKKNDFIECGVLTQ
jgi:hypothetical protein